MTGLIFRIERKRFAGPYCNSPGQWHYVGREDAVARAQAATGADARDLRVCGVQAGPGGEE